MTVTMEVVDGQPFFNCKAPIDKITPSRLESASKFRAWSTPRFNEYAHTSIASKANFQNKIEMSHLMQKIIRLMGVNLKDDVNVHVPPNVNSLNPMG